MKIHFEYDRSLGNLPITIEVKNIAIKISVELVEKIFKAIKEDQPSLFNTNGGISCYYADSHVGFSIGENKSDISIKFTVTSDDFGKVYRYVKNEERTFLN